MILLTAAQARYTGFSPKNSEEFTSASRSVKPGLIASGIVSAWTWAATLVSDWWCKCSPSINIFIPSYKVVPSRTSLVFLVHGGMAVRVIPQDRFSNRLTCSLAGATVQILLFAMVSRA